jgi:ribosomal protein S11
MSFYLIEKRVRLGLKKQKKQKISKYYIDKGLYFLYIKSSLKRGLHINISNHRGKVLKIFTLGQFGYEKSQRYKQISFESLLEGILDFLENVNPELTKLCIFLKGFHFRRKKIIQFLLKSSIRLSIISITDLSDIPYNGCRPKKLRRK